MLVKSEGRGQDMSVKKMLREQWKTAILCPDRHVRFPRGSSAQGTETDS